MSVTYLMQYSVQYIIAPVVFGLFFFSTGQRKTEGLASLSMKKKGQSRIYIQFFLCDSSSVLFSSELLCQCSSHPLFATFFQSDMDKPAWHNPTIYALLLCFSHPEFNLLTTRADVDHVADSLVPGGEE